MHESRLFQILYYLLDKGYATAPELAEKLEVSVRTIYRDIDALSGAGIPVYAEPGRRGGIRLMNGFVLDKTVLSDEEKGDILSAIQNLSIAKSGYAQDTLQKLSALFHLSANDWYEIDFSRWGKKSQDNEKFELLKHAIISHNVVKIFYTNSFGSQEERLIQPIKLLYKSKEWYLKAFCRKKQDFRLFKLNRIIQYELLEETFPPILYPEKSITDDSEEEYSVEMRLRFSKEAAYRVYDEFDNSQIERMENGELIVCARMPQSEWLIGWLLSFGTQLEVMEPPFLRDILEKQAREISRKYSGHQS